VTDSTQPDPARPRTAAILVAALVAAMMLAGADTARAGFITVASKTLAELDAGDTLSTGGFQFSQFDLINAVGDGGAIPPNPASVIVVAGYDDVFGDVALQYLMSLNAASGQTLNLQFSFQATAPPGVEFDSVNMNVFGSSADGNGLVSVIETVLDRPTGPDAVALANLGASNQNGSLSDVLSRTQDLSLADSPVWVLTSINVTGGVAGSGQLSRFEQYFSNRIVPEPATATLAAAALATLAGMAYRRRRLARFGPR
jgi:hypothetical protein